MKVALLFDIFTERGGAERVAIMLAKALDADIYTTYVDWDNVDRELQNLNVNEIGLTLKNAKILTYSEIALRFLKFKAKDYDVFLFSRVYAFPAVENNHPSIWISSGVLDLAYEYFVKRIPLYKKLPFSVWFQSYRHFTSKWIGKFDKILANSNFTKRMIKKYYDTSASVAYHPVDTKKFRCKKYDDFYFMPSRLTIDKKIDVAIEAFREIPKERLVIVGDGPEKGRLKDLAKNCRNIKILDAMDHEKLRELYATCTATLSLGAIESLGLVPLESMASGKPCIVSNIGGHKETVVHGKTGFLINLTKEEIKKHVRSLTPQVAKNMKRDCMKRAKKFNVETFIREVKEEIQDLVTHSK